MKELSDDELDGLFRKSFEEFDPPFEANDWNKLRERLDTADGTPVAEGWINKYWPLATLLLIMIGGIGVYFGTEDGKVGEKRDTVLSVPVEPPSGQSAQEINELHPTISQQEAAETPSLSNTGTLPGIDTEAGSLPDKVQVGPNKEIRELPRNLANVSGVRAQSNLADFSDRGDGAVFLQKESTGTPGLKNISTFLQSNLPDPISDTELAADVIGQSLATPHEAASKISLPSLELLMARGITASDTPMSLPDVVSPLSTDSAASPTLPTRIVSPWAIRIGVAPDMSTVNMNMQDFDRPGPSASLLVERAITERLFVQTGVVRSLKTYRAQAGEYEWPSNWTQSQMPTSVDGACRVFEVPINLRYDIVQRAQSSWFAGLGVSSYKMQNEKYTYHYKVNDPSIRWWNWEGKTGWYLFSHLNVSLGYERQLSKRLSVVIEPHLRAPLRKVGFGKVNLFTTGVWAAVRYTPAFRK